MPINELFSGAVQQTVKMCCMTGVTSQWGITKTVIDWVFGQQMICCPNPPPSPHTQQLDTVTSIC